MASTPLASVLEIASKLCPTEHVNQIGDENETATIVIASSSTLSSASSTIAAYTPPDSPHPPTSAFAFEHTAPTGLTPIHAEYYPSNLQFKISPTTVDVSIPLTNPPSTC